MAACGPKSGVTTGALMRSSIPLLLSDSAVLREGLQRYSQLQQQTGTIEIVFDGSAARISFRRPLACRGVPHTARRHKKYLHCFRHIYRDMIFIFPHFAAFWAHFLWFLMIFCTFFLLFFLHLPCLIIGGIQNCTIFRLDACRRLTKRHLLLSLDQALRAPNGRQ